MTGAGAFLADTMLAGSNMDLRPGTDGPGIIAFLIVAGLVLVCVFLYRSMRKHLRNVDFENPTPSGGAGRGDGSAGSEPT